MGEVDEGGMASRSREMRLEGSCIFGQLSIRLGTARRLNLLVRLEMSSDRKA